MHPQKCREQALCCKQLALKTPSAQAKASFLDLARDWKQLAAEIEGDDRFLKTMADMECWDKPEAA